MGARLRAGCLSCCRGAWRWERGRRYDDFRGAEARGTDDSARKSVGGTVADARWPDDRLASLSVWRR